MSVNNLEVRTTNQSKMSIDQVNFFQFKLLNSYATQVFTSPMFPKSRIPQIFKLALPLE